MVLLKNVSPPSEGIRHEEHETTVFMDGKELGSGTLYVAESRLSWFDASGMGFSLEYPSISRHAASHLYLVLSSTSSDALKKRSKTEDDEEEEGDESSDNELSPGLETEIRFVPSDKASLKPMFAALCECRALHPDPEDSDSDFEGDEYDVEEAEQAQVHLSDLYPLEEGMAHLTPGSFECLQEVQDQPSVQQIHMAGVRTNSASTGLEGEADLG